MWAITKQARAQHEAAHLFIMRETDEEWEQVDDLKHEAYRAVHFEKIKPQLYAMLPVSLHVAFHQQCA